MFKLAILRAKERCRQIKLDKDRREMAGVKLAKSAVLIGNGTSRVGIDLEKLREIGPTIGCNMLYKDFSPDYIVAADSEPMDELRKVLREYKPRWKLVTRAWLTNANTAGVDNRLGFWWLVLESTGTTGVEKITAYDRLTKHIGNNSGMIGAWWAFDHLKVKRLYLAGVDFFRKVGDNGEPNDVYHDHELTHMPGMVEGYNTIKRSYPHAEIIRIGEVPDRDKDWFAEKLPYIKVISDAKYR